MTASSPDTPAARERISRSTPKRRLWRWLLAGGALLLVGGAFGVLALMGGRGDVVGPSLADGDGGLDASAPAIDDPSNAQAVSAQTPVQLDVYADYTHPESARFASVNALVIQGLAQQGAVRVSVHPVAISDDPAVNEAALRAANAVTCVGELSQSELWAFHVGLLALQPSQGPAQLQNADLIALARDSGVRDENAVTECITDGSYSQWVAAESAEATQGGVGDEERPLVDMPVVLADGDHYEGRIDNSAEFRDFLSERMGG